MNPNYQNTVFHFSPGRKPRDFWIITAWNPNGKTADEGDNLAADAELESLLTARTLRHFRVIGASPDEEHAEPGWGVICSRTTALEIGNQFDQEAVFHFGPEEVTLVPCRGEGDQVIGKTAELTRDSRDLKQFTVFFGSCGDSGSNEPEPNIALFDLDGSLCDYDGHLRKSLGYYLGPDVLAAAGGELRELEKNLYHGRIINLIRSNPGWWREIPPIRENLAVFHLAESLGFENNVLTKGPALKPNAWTEKLQWCHDHLGTDIPVHVVSDKGLVYGKVLFDDWPAYMLAWLKYRPRGLGIMPVQPWNKEFEHPNVLKFNGTNLTQVRDALTQVRDRKPGERLVIP